MPVSFENVPSNAAASGVFVEAQNVRRSVAGGVIPHKILLLGQFNADKTPDTSIIQPVLSLAQAKDRYGRGSMLALMAKKAFDTAKGVPIYAAAIENDGSGVVASGSITFANAATSSGVHSIYIAGVRVRTAVADEATAASQATAMRDAINANADLPVIASIETGAPTVVELVSKWEGLSANTISIHKNLRDDDAAQVPTATTVTISAMASGAADPDISTALALMGEEHYTVIACPYEGDEAYNALRLKGNELYQPIQKRPFVSFVGYNGDYEDLLTALGDRNSQWVSIVPVADSVSMPLEIAASVSGAVGLQAQLDPARPARTLELIGIMGAREQWVYSNRNAVVLAGGSTTKTDSSGVVRIEDLVTTYTEDDDETENSAWRFVETVTNVQNKIYQIDQTFKGRPFSQSIIVDDDSTTSKEYAVRPRTVKSYAIALVDNWVAQAWSKNRDEIVAGIFAEINEGNPNRIDLLIPDVFAAGGKIVAVKLEWDFLAPQIQ